MPRPRSKFAAVIATLSLAAAVSAQDRARSLEWVDHRSINSGEIHEPWSRQTEVVELEEILIAGKVIHIGDQTPAGIDWVNQITFRVKNLSSENITWIQISLRLPQMKYSPQIQYVPPCGNRQPEICMRPGEQVELKMPGKIYSFMKERVAEEMELSEITRAAIDVVFVATPSTSVTMFGCMRTADPRNTCPHKYS
jgi:hypothetical protein